MTTASAFLATCDADGILTLSWDMPGRSMNVMDGAGLVALKAAFDAAFADPGVRGILLTSAKADFAAGMDLAFLAGLMADGEGPAPAAALFAAVQRLHALLRKIEKGGAMTPGQPAKPIAAALPGLAVGFGYELALACHQIFLADRPGARVGLPEIRLGLFPGAGGTTRLVRRLGLLGAAPFLVQGQLREGKAAETAGLVDALCPPDALLAKARAWLLAAPPAATLKPWDAPGGRVKIPGGGPFHPSGFPLFVGAAAEVGGQMRGLYPAAEALLQAAYEGAQVDFDTATRLEARHFVKVLRSPEALAMVRSLFVNKDQLDKGLHRPAGVAAARPGPVGVVGGGVMGRGIARVLAEAGFSVTLCDESPAKAEAAKAALAATWDGRKAHALQSGAETAALLARISPTAALADLQGASLVIEAVSEDLSLKRKLLPQIAAAAGPDAVLATNTSSLPLALLGADLPDPTRFLGLHFFSPVEKMALVEIVRGPQSGPAALAFGFDLVRALKKTPILVGDRPFFYANRCFLPFLFEGITMVGEGVPPALIESAARAVGMPLGPLQLADALSLDLGLKIVQAHPDAPFLQNGAPRVIAALTAAGRHGRDGRAGFYDYGADGQRLLLWPGLGALRPDPAPPAPALAALSERLLLVQVIEALRAFEDGTLGDVREGDVGAILGWGFAPWTGGPFSWVDRQGAAAVLTQAARLAAAHGPRFAPPALLRQMAETGARFYHGAL